MPPHPGSVASSSPAQVDAAVAVPVASAAAKIPAVSCPLPLGSPQAIAPVAASPATQVSCPSSTSQPIALGIFTLLVGAWITHRLSARRELRKECRTEVDACCKMIADLLDKGRKCFALLGSEEEARKLSSEVVFDLHRLTKRVERLKLRYRYFAIERSLDALSESLTGDDFDSKDRPSYPRSSDRVRSIEEDVHGLMDALEDGFSTSFDRSEVSLAVTSVKSWFQRSN